MPLSSAADPLPAAAAPRRSRGPLILAGTLAILLMTFLAYLPVLRAGFIWDDDDYVTRNLSLRSTPGLARIWLEPSQSPQYYPLVLTTFWASYQLWGAQPLGYHLTNVLLHGLAAVAVWRVLVRLGLTEGVAWVAAAVFALHPVCVESVAWVTERKNVLMGLLYMLALWCYLHFDALSESPDATTPDIRPRRWGWYAGALALFIGAMLSKTVASSFSVVAAVLIWWKRGRLRLRDVLPLIPFFVLALPLALNTAYLERTRVGALGAEWAFSPAQRVLIAGRSLWFYIGKLLWPARLSFIYEHWDVRPAIPWQWLFPLAASAAALTLLLSARRIGRGPLAAVAFFVLTLAPALGFVNIYPMRYTFVADHYQYLACLGLIVLAVAVVARGLRALPAQRGPLAAGALATGILLTLGSITFARCGAYRDLETLWRNTIAMNPRAAIAYNNLGLILRDKGQTDDAIACFTRALDVNPNHYEAHNNLAIILWSRGEQAGAIAHVRAAVAANPDYADAQANLGFMLAAQGQLGEAIEHDRAAIRADPRNTDAYNNLALALQARGQNAEAVEQFRQALTIGPRNAGIHDNLGQLLLTMGRTDEAIAEFSLAIANAPRNKDFANDYRRAIEAHGPVSPKR